MINQDKENIDVTYNKEEASVNQVEISHETSNDINQLLSRTTEALDEKTHNILDNRTTQVVDNRQTETLDQYEQTSVDQRVTQAMDHRETEAFETTSSRNTQDNYGVKRTKIDAGDIIGTGYVVGDLLTDSSGEADIHKCSKDRITYVAKIYKRSYSVDLSVKEKISQIDSPYVMKIIESGFHNGRHFEIIPYYKNGTLFDNLETLDINFIKNTVVFEVNEGLKAIHDVDMSHNDIKPHNIFITDDNKHVVIGDFGILKDLQGRTYVTKTGVSMTLMYAAPEADESTSKMVDYFAFGMTLLHIGFRRDPFVGLVNKKVRMLLLNYAQRIPEEIDNQLADLIAKLIKHAPYERLDYQGVHKWVVNKSAYLNARNEINQRSSKYDTLSNVYTFKANGVEMKLSTVESLTETLNDNWNDALKHYNSFLIPEAIKATNAELYLELKEIYEKNKNNSNIGLFFTLHRLNPELDFVYIDEEFGDFAGYINHLISHYPSYNPDLINIDILENVIVGHGINKKSPDVLLRLQEIFKTISDKDLIVDAIINTFKPIEKVFINKTIYEDLVEFSKYMFDNHGEPVIFDLESNIRFFYNMLLKPYKIEEEKLNKLINEENRFYRYCLFSYTISNKFNINAKVGTITSFYDFINLAKKAYLEKKEKLVSYLEKFMHKNYHRLIHEIESGNNIELLDKVDTYSNKYSKLACLYFFTDQHAKLNQHISSLQDIVDMLSNVDREELITLSTDFLTDEIFMIWLNSKGYSSDSIEKFIRKTEESVVMI